MIKRELYMKKIRPFMGGELIKVMTGMRRSGKSVMLELIKEELVLQGIDRNNFISFNFEDMRYSNILTSQALHDEIIKTYQEKSICFLMKYRKLKTGKSALTHSELSLTATYILLAPMPNCFPASLPHILAADM